MAGKVGVGNRTGWFRLPLTKRSSSQPAFRDTDNPALSRAENELAEVIEQMFESLPTDLEDRYNNPNALADYDRQVLGIFASFNDTLRDIFLRQYLAGAQAGMKELTLMLSAEYAAFGKAEAPLPSQAVLGYSFNSRNPNSQLFAQNQSASLVTNMGVTQRGTIRSVVDDAFKFQRTPSQTSRALFDTLSEMKPQSPAASEFTRLFGTNAGGLTARQEKALVNRGNKIATELAERGITGQKLLDKVKGDTEKYADRLRRARSKTIARTEILRANNEGRLASFQQAANDGLINKKNARKRWTVSPMDVCPVCTPLDGQMVPLDDKFSTGNMTPPAHPNCRCSFNVEPNIQTTQVPKTTGDGTPSNPYRLEPDRGFTPQGQEFADTPLPDLPDLPSGSGIPQVPTPPAPAPAPAPTPRPRSPRVPKAPAEPVAPPVAPPVPTPAPPPAAPTPPAPKPAPAPKPPKAPKAPKVPTKRIKDDVKMSSGKVPEKEVREKQGKAILSFMDSKVRLIADDGAEYGTRIEFRGITNQSLGGTFEPYKEGERFKVHGISVSRRARDTLGDEGVTFAHEFGHRVDRYKGKYISRDTSFLRDLAAQGDTTFMPNPAEVADAVDEFVMACKESPSILKLIEENADDRKWVNYATSPHEMFARAYAQWVTEGMRAKGVATAAGMRVGIIKSAQTGYAWTDAEWSVIGPLLEKILRVRGMIV